MKLTFTEIKEAAPGVALITMKRSEKRNALSIELMQELTEILEGLDTSYYRVVILTGEGPAFCAGLDLVQSSDPQLIEIMAQHVARLLKAVYMCPLPTIAAIQGDAVAGGAGLVVACDYALISAKARIGFPEVRRGLVAAQVASLLYRQIAARDVKELLLLGEMIDSPKAVTMRLVNRVVSHDQLLDEALKTAQTILLGAPGAIKSSKLLLEQLQPTDFFESLQTALSFHQSARHSSEAKEGIAAFLEKRKPSWIKEKA